MQNSHTAEKNLSDWCFGGCVARRVRASIRLHREIFMKTPLFGDVPLITLLVPLVKGKIFAARPRRTSPATSSRAKAMRSRGSFVDPRAAVCAQTIAKNRGGSSAKPHMIPSIAACFGAAIGNDADLQHKQ